jgi:transcription termination factor NusB
MTDTGLATRKAAIELLRAVLAQRRPIDEALDGHLALREMEPRDRAFTRLLLTTMLRRLGQLDALIDSALKAPLPRAAATVRDVLRLGLAQRLFLATPSHAAVDTSVELAGMTGFAGMKGLVNAVLRRLAEDGPALLTAQDAPRLNTPEWLWSRLEETYGKDTAAAIAEAHLREAALDLSVKADPDVWATQLEARQLPSGSLRREAGGLVPELPGFAEGAWWVQDAAAALPARLQAFRRHPGPEPTGCFAVARARRGRRPDGRQRRRQVDAGQDHRRQFPPDPRRDPHGRAEHRLHQARRGPPARHRGRLSGSRALRQSDRRRQCLPRPRDQARRAVPFLDTSAMNRAPLELFAELKSETRPRDLVKQMSGGQRQAVAIARTRCPTPRSC